MTDTIYAPATAPGRAAVAVMRLSGPRTAEAVAALCGGLPEARRASLRRIRRAGGETIDEGLVLWFPAPGSYTGEDSAEFQIHGGPAVVGALAKELERLGLRPAEPGEFTRRAFENGRLDLTQAEAVADLIDAQTEAQRRQALAQLDGALGRRHEAWRAALLEALALLEAEIDFPDEDLPGALASRARPRLQRLAAEIDAALADADRGERVREGWSIVLMGAPNAGKSSLFNALLRREAAIVTPQPGTTRDALEAELALGPWRVLLVDTAGIRATADPVEAEGVRRARERAAQAGLRVWVVDASAPDPDWREGLDLLGPGDLTVFSKVDLASPTRGAAGPPGLETAAVSARTGEGLDRLADLLARRAEDALSGAEFPAVTRQRHRRRLLEARDHLARAVEALDGPAELAAEDLRLAARALARVTGRVDPEDVLDVVFSTFCIGK